MEINLSSIIEIQISNTGIDRATLIRDFSDAMNYHDTEMFGRNKRNSNSDLLYHIHVIPDKTDTQNRNDWESKYNRKAPSDSRTSDNFIFYTFTNNKYLLLTLVYPGGHEELKDKEMMKRLEKWAFDYVKHGIIP